MIDASTRQGIGCAFVLFVPLPFLFFGLALRPDINLDDFIFWFRVLVVLAATGLFVSVNSFSKMWTTWQHQRAEKNSKPDANVN